ncbi:MAG TPA: PstS family phosphate ABC transporter substrate-binding protein [Kofleriaceae bacterium]|nr:PstS family phosphate ABC transporter substrate-binding protein [Kofleriaceae bacterium]
MTLSTVRTAAAVAALVAALVPALVAASGCTSHRGAGRPVRIDGSSTVFLISQAVAEDLTRSHQAQVTVGASGTGGGFKKFCRGELDVNGASRPIKATEAAECERHGVRWLELPVAYDGIAVVVNRKDTWVDHLTVDELRRIWQPEAQGTITRWSQVRDGFPDRPLRLFGAGVDSGTYDYFTAAVVGKEHSSRGDYTQSEDDNTLVTGVAADEDALGFFGLAYFVENQDKLKLVPIDDGRDDDGTGPIAPSAASVTDGSYQPLARPIFIYASVAALERPEVERVVSYYLDHASTLAPAVGYVALPAEVGALARKRYDARRTGSVFAGGSRVGVTLEQLLSSEQAGT